MDSTGLAKLPDGPPGLGKGWVPDPTHKNPNGEKWRNPDSGKSIEWHPGQPGKPGWRGKNHWHWDGGEDHLPPGTDVPDFPEPDLGPDSGGDSSDSLMECGANCQRVLVATRDVLTGLLIFVWVCISAPVGS